MIQYYYYYFFFLKKVYRTCDSNWVFIYVSLLEIFSNVFSISLCNLSNFDFVSTNDDVIF